MWKVYEMRGTFLVKSGKLKGKGRTIPVDNLSFNYGPVYLIHFISKFQVSLIFY